MQNIRTANDDQTANRSGRSGTIEIRRLSERIKELTGRWSGRKATQDAISDEERLRVVRD